MVPNKRVCQGNLRPERSLLLKELLSKKMARIVVIGAGYGGATCASNLEKLLPNAEITVVEGRDSMVHKVNSCNILNLLTQYIPFSLAVLEQQLMDQNSVTKF